MDLGTLLGLAGFALGSFLNLPTAATGGLILLCALIHRLLWAFGPGIAAKMEFDPAARWKRLEDLEAKRLDLENKRLASEVRRLEREEKEAARR